MKICILTPKFPPDVGGVAQATKRIGESIKSSGHDVLWVTPGSPLASNTDSVWRIPMEDIPKAIKSWMPDLIHAFYPSIMGEVGLLLKSQLSVPLVLSCRGNDVDRDPWNPVLFKNILNVLLQADAVTGVTQDLVNKVRALGVAHNLSKFVGNSVDTTHFRPLEGSLRKQIKVSKDDHLLGVFGEIRLKKGLPLILLAFKALKKTHRGLKLVFVGPIRQGPPQEIVSVFFEQNPFLKKDFYHLPYQTHQALPRIYSDIDTVLLPSYQEGMSNVMLEAMSCGRRVIASSVGGFPDIIKHGKNGYLIPPFELEPLIDAIQDSILTPENSLGFAARQQIKNSCEPRHENEKYLKLYEALLDKKNKDSNRKRCNSI